MPTGYLRKMGHTINKDDTVDYYLRLYEDRKTEPSSYKDGDILLNKFLGQKIKLEFQNDLACVGCGREIKKTFNQGYCFPCLRDLAECDTCIIKPELCHFDKGTCRDSEWGEKHCNIPHSIYISLTSGVKIGITRQFQEKTRWVDQGAVKALRIATVDRRKTAGLVEVEIAKSMADKTNWRNMLKNDYEDVDLSARRDEIFEEYEDLLCEYSEEDAYGSPRSARDDSASSLHAARDDSASLRDDSRSNPLDNALIIEEDSRVQEIKYPVLEYPVKIQSHNFDKNPLVEGTLQGIKGQYLLLDTGVINLRKFAGYKVSFEAF